MEMKRLFIASAAVLLLLLPVVAVQALPGEIELIGKLWDHDPLTVYIHASPRFQVYVPEVLTALNDWSHALEDTSGKPVDDSEIGVADPDGVFDFQVVDSRKDADIIIHIRGGAYAGVLGITIWRDTDRDGYFDKVKITVKVGPGAGFEDFRNVVRHEIGHALGLGHEITDESDLMDPTYDASETNVDVHPSDLDIGALLYIYGTDGFSLPNLPPEEIPSTYSE